MKFPKLLGLLFLAAWFLPAQAQFDGVGFKVGLNVGSPVTEPTEGASGSPGVTGLKGMFFRFNLPNEKMQIQAEALFSLKAATFASPFSGDTIIYQYIPGVGSLPFPADFSAVVEGRFRNHYLEVPVTFRYLTSEHFAVYGGLYGAYLLMGDNTGLADVQLGTGFGFREDEPFDQTEFLFPWDYGVVAGSEYRCDNIFFDLRATVGLGSIYQRDYAQVDSPVRNIYLQGSIGYYLQKKASKE